MPPRTPGPQGVTSPSDSGSKAGKSITCIPGLGVDKLSAYVGKSVEDFCPFGYGKKKDVQNHCAHQNGTRYLCGKPMSVEWLKLKCCAMVTNNNVRQRRWNSPSASRARRCSTSRRPAFAGLNCLASRDRHWDDFTDKMCIFASTHLQPRHTRLGTGNVDMEAEESKHLRKGGYYVRPEEMD